MSSCKPNRREFLLSTAVVASAGSGLVSGSRLPQDRPNILLITDDQHNAHNLGCYGDPLVKTPNLDRLAARGVLFKRAYSQSLICGPSRVSIITGQYVHSHGYYGNYGPPHWYSSRPAGSRRKWHCDCDNSSLRPGSPIWIPTYFRQYGYQTAILGKAHYGYQRIAQEFDYFRLSNVVDAPPDDPLKIHWFQFLIERRGAIYEDRLESSRRPNSAFRSRLPKRLSQEWWVGDRAIEFLRNRDRSKPFFVSINFRRPHAPIAAPAPYDTMYPPEEVKLPPSVSDPFHDKPAEQFEAARRSTYPYHPSERSKLRQIIAMYFGLITLIDDNLGRILDELDAQGLTNNTLVIFTSDHGDFSGEHGFFHKNLGMYEAIHRIPYIVAGPGFDAGQVRNELVEQVDIFPTVCDVAGLPIPESVQGLSLKQLATHDVTGWPRTAAFGEMEDRKCVRTTRYRMVYDPIGNFHELYDHSHDPWELTNLYNDPDHKNVRLQLMDEFMKFYARTEQQTIFTSWLPKRRDEIPPGPTRDIWRGKMSWKEVKKSTVSELLLKSFTGLSLKSMF